MQLLLDRLGYRLTPYSSGLCYELSKYMPERVVDRGPHKGKIAPAAWKSLDRYPATIPAGIQMVIDLETNADPAVIRDLKSAVARMEKIRAAAFQVNWHPLGVAVAPAEDSAKHAL